MKTFFKMLLATVLGGIVLLFLIFIVLASIASMAKQEFIVQNNSVLVLDLNNEIHDRANNNPFSGINPLTQETQDALGLDKIMAALFEAAHDNKIAGVYIKGGIPITGSSTALELRNALKKFRESGKFVYSYSQVMTQKGYLIASAADSVLMNPEGYFEWKGLSSTVPYFQNALNKLGIEPVVFRATGNKYKSAVEPFIRQDISEENKEQLTNLLSSVWGDYLNDISQSRGVDIKTLNTLADSMVVTHSEAAAQYKLIDRVAYKDELMKVLLNKTHSKSIDKIPFIPIEKYGETAELGSGNFSDPKIAVIIAQGDIVSGDAGEYKIGDDRINEALRKAREDSSVKAVVLRVNSPGGSALASETIWREVELTRQVKPVVASMGDLAASGGYYISCVADTIVAEPTTITGSIGAFGLFFTGEELMHDKLGINLETVKTNKYGDLGQFDKRVTPAEKRMLIDQIDQVYNTFKKRVAEGRSLPLAQVDSLAGGHVYSGRDAIKLGLVDVLGGLPTALNIAANMAHIKGDYRVVEYPELKSNPIFELIKKYKDDYETKLVNEKLGPYAKYLDIIGKAKKMQGIQTRLPYDLEIE